MNALTATSVHAAHAYRAWTKAPAASTSAQIPPAMVTNRRVAAVKIELSAQAHSHLAQCRNASLASGELSASEFNPHAISIAPNGAGRREAPMRTAAKSDTPAYRPPGATLDFRV